MLDDWVYTYVPRLFCGRAFVVNPVFVYLIFTEDTSKFGNYRFVLLFFAVFNLTYSVVNVLVPLDIHTYRYCFFLITRNGWFVQNNELNFQMMAGRCSLVAASYAILLIHFIYRYLAIHKPGNPQLHAHTEELPLICSIPGRANMEIRQYIREEFRQTYGNDSMEYNMLGALFHEGSEETRIKSWIAVGLWSGVSTVSIIMFLILARMIVKRLNSMTITASKKTSKFQVELLRALFVQTVVPLGKSCQVLYQCWGIQVLSTPFTSIGLSCHKSCTIIARTTQFVKDHTSLGPTMEVWASKTTPTSLGQESAY